MASQSRQATPTRLVTGTYLRMSSQPTYSDIMRALIDAFSAQRGRRLTDNELAEAVGMHQPTVTRLRQGKYRDPKTETLAPVARFFNITVAQLRGEVPLPFSAEAGNNNRIGEAPALYMTVRRVPLIATSTAGRWMDLESNARLAQVIGWVPSAADCGPDAFAVIVEGPSMQAPSAPSFAPGECVIVDPERIPENGCVVLVELGSNQPPLLRQLVIEAGRVLLQARNPQWPQQIVELPKAGRILGRAIFKGVPV